MQRNDLQLTGVGGVALRARSWVGEAPPAAILVISHGLAEHGGRYDHVATRMVAEGHAVYALDHRGHGRSGGRRANVDRFDYLVSDLHELVAHARRAGPGLPVFLLGHSMGGAIAFGYALRHQDELQALALSAPALAAGDAVPALQLLLVRILSVILPNLGALMLPASAVSRDPAVVKAYEEDPLNFRGSIPARTLAELMRAMQGFAGQAPQIRLPVLVQHGTADALVPLAATQPVYERIGSTDRTVKLYEGLFHEVLNEPERDRVLDDLVAWLAERR
jgi:alpha-beta hydrolase superfamily lysophospholipase